MTATEELELIRSLRAEITALKMRVRTLTAGNKHETAEQNETTVTTGEASK